MNNLLLLLSLRNPELERVAHDIICDMYMTGASAEAIALKTAELEDMLARDRRMTRLAWEMSLILSGMLIALCIALHLSVTR